MHAKESVAEPTEEVIMDVADNTANIDVVNDVDQLQDDSVSKTYNAPKKNWFRESPRPHTYDTLTFDELMATPIDFFKFAKNHLKIDKLTKADLVGPVCKLLKGTCQSSIKLEYNMEEYNKAVSDQLDWENPKGDRFPFDLSKPLPLKAHPDMLLLVVQHNLFNLNGDAIVDLAVVLRMFTKRIVIQKRVEDVQLGVEIYQKKLNLTKPQKDFLGIYAKELYTLSFDPQRIVYEDLSNQKRIMQADELNRNSNSCNDGAYVSAEGETLGMSVELEGGVATDWFALLMGFLDLAAIGVFLAIMGIGPTAIKRIYRYNVQEDCFAMNYTSSSSSLDLAAIGVFLAIMGIGPAAIKRIYRYNVQEDCFAMNYTSSSSSLGANDFLCGYRPLKNEFITRERSKKYAVGEQPGLPADQRQSHR
uniref:Uncharacterized protein n=1 Tax=Tanacetum cinerariifolium TaxID=118510 RepID=A0A6L2JDH0_TANCI|nr:hypothetical protein [Tanacetum cinerariifolium]